MKAIEPGCWAILGYASPCCGRKAGEIDAIPFLVTSITIPNDRYQCHFCRKYLGKMPIAWGYLNNPDAGIPLPLLKRLDDPPAEQTDTSADVTVKERV